MKRKPLARRAALWIVNGIFAVAAVVVVSAALFGCADLEAGYRAYTDRLRAEVPSIVAESGLAERIESKVTDRLGPGVGAALGDSLKVGLDTIVSKIPKPEPAPEGSSPVAESVGTFLALVTAMFARDKLRDRKKA